MTLPNFLIIGAQKSGSTWLARNLGQHPEIFIPSYEIHFFNKPNNFIKGLPWYEKHFRLAQKEKAIGEKTPEYLCVKHQVNIKDYDKKEFLSPHLNIYNCLPNIKLIIILRNPVDRAISAINHFRARGRISPLINIDQFILRHKNSLMQEDQGILAMGKYYQSISTYYEYFHPDQILILIFEEDVVKKPLEGLTKVCNFLGVDSAFDFKLKKSKINKFLTYRIGTALGFNLFFTRPIFRFFNKHIPSSIYYLDKVPLMGPRITKAIPSKAIIDELYELYTEENKKLFNLLGRDLTSWQP